MATPSRAASGRGSALRAPLTPLVGRAQELKAVGEALRRARLVTVAGPGGGGKKHLRRVLAQRLEQPAKLDQVQYALRTLQQRLKDQKEEQGPGPGGRPGT